MGNRCAERPVLVQSRGSATGRSSGSRWRRRIGVPLALFSALGVAGSSAITAVAAGEPLIKLASDPYADPAAIHKTTVEPASFAFGNTSVMAVQAGRFSDGGADNFAWSTTINGGTSFTGGLLPGTTKHSTPPGKYARLSDPSVAYDAKHSVWLIEYLGLITATTVDVALSRSTNGGLAWGPLITVDNRGTTQGRFLDKNWMTCDNTPSSPHYGNCYSEYDEAAAANLIWMTTSSDGGLHWTAAKNTASSNRGIGGEPLVQPNGHVVVPILSLDSPTFPMVAFMSTNGGGSWSSAKLISKESFHHAAGNIRNSFPLPSAAVDKAGKIYVTWQDCDFEAGCTANDIVMSTSTNGTTWTAMARIPIDAVGSGVDHFIPGFTVDGSTSGSSAGLALDYYYYPKTNCTASTCQLDVGYISSPNGGATWVEKEQLAGPMKLSWLPTTTQGSMAGDFIATSITPTTHVSLPIFCLANAPTGSVLDVATYTIHEEVG